MRQLDNVSVRLTYPISNTRPPDNPQYARIVVKDEASSTPLLEVTLEPEQLFSLMAGDTAYGLAGLTEHPDRAGKRMVHDMVDVSEYLLPADCPADHPRLAEAVAATRADGWESAEYRRSHGRHFLIVRKWLDPQDDENEGTA